MKKITMNDVANYAGVSQSTVSRVLNNSSKVNDVVTNKVNEAIETLGYIPNRAAQTLKSNKTQIIGVSITDIFNPYFVELIATIEKECRLKGYSILLHSSNQNPLLESENIDNFISRQVDGFIFVPTSDYNLEKIKNCNIPNISITSPIKGIDSISLNHIEGGAISAKHFISKGHSKFAAIAKNDDEKLIGFLSEIESQGYNINPSNIFEWTIANTVYERKIEINKILDKRKKELDFTALFCTNDTTANEFIKLAQERGYSVPKDISVIGFDDTYISKTNAITSVSQPLDKMVQNGLEILLEKMENNNKRQPVDLRLSPVIVPRGSTNICY